MIPTTSGSGSEVTDFAVITRGDVKYPLVDDSLCPDVAILDESLLKGLPKSLIADAGFDVLGHALEAYTAKGANGFTDALAKEAFCTALAKLPASFSGDVTVRFSVHQAATMAGLAFTQAGLGLCHAMAHSLGAAYHLPHGRLIAILLPAVMDHNAPGCSAKYAALARSAGLPGTADTLAVRSLRNALLRLRKELQLPSTLKAAGVDPRQVWQDREKLVQTVLADPCCENNPIPPTDLMVLEILEAVTGNG
jgi:alcohol dehydrogenase class IV